MLLRRVIAVLCLSGFAATFAFGADDLDRLSEELRREVQEDARQEALARIYDHPGPVIIVPRDAPPPAEVDMLKVRFGDPALHRAFLAARDSLPAALAATEKRNGWFSPSLALYVAVRVADPDKQIEFVWVDNIRRDGKGYAGTLASHPRYMPGLRLRSPIAFLNPQVADWAVQAEDGRYYGYFITRARLKDIAEPLAGQIRALMVARPVPLIWQ
ncbi:DUF2314 domain-containing protein [Maliponia aquimaris]|uniref:DUF2314 domain-containing protein n=1 Tax=Maliponia aquimaris TaxID=1673631 RepID=A0A238L3X6_9RHOB|nr:DUF2314 domain-containing protein [Maliponia aquimaris]SMX49560.1 hypothetical protein MAA8898_04344 [Maliponia aquimaris]